jgi:adenylate cyclase, class 2
MHTEIEAMFVGVSHEVLREKLGGLGAELITPERLIRRTIFDYEDLRLDAQAAWIRLRDEGDKITLTYKQRKNETIDGMVEIEIVVDDFDKTKALLIAAGLTVKAEQETKRELWMCGEVEIMLDTWPWLEQIVEVEAKSEEVVKEMSSRLELDWGKAIFDSTDKLYQMVFDVTRTEISTHPIVFGPVPEWLEARRRV